MSEEENSEEEQPIEPEEQEQEPLERPQTVEIHTPLERPEFDPILNMFMQKLNIRDRKQASIALSNLMYDFGLDPNADLKELAAQVAEVNGLLQQLPDTPQARQVKDTLGGVLTTKMGRVAINRASEIAKSDSTADRFEKMMDKYIPYVIFFNNFGKLMNPNAEQPNNSHQQQTPKAEIPEAFKQEMENIKKQLEMTQNLLKQQEEDRKQKQFADNIITTVHDGINPQIEAIRAQMENLTLTLQSKISETQAQPQEAKEAKEVLREIQELKQRIGTSEARKGLSLDDVNTVLDTVSTLESRLKKDVPAGEFDWKTATVNTLGEIGKEAVSVLKEIQTGKNPQSGVTMMASQNQYGNSRIIAKQKLQNYILQNLQKGQNQIVLGDAQKMLGLDQQEILEAYNELIKEGWIKAPEQPNQTQATPPPPPPNNMTSPHPPNPTENQNPNSQQTQQNKIPQPPERFKRDAPFLET